MLGVYPYFTLAGLTAFGIWIAVTLISRYVSLASILGAASFPLFAWLLSRTHPEAGRPVFYIAVQAAVALIIIAKHHQNIRRLLAGTESRFGKGRFA